MRKQWIAAFLCLLMVLSLCACGGGQSTEEPVEELKCSFDIETPGEILTDAEPLSSNVVTVDGAAISLPVTVAQLKEAGWSFQQAYDIYGYPVVVENERVAVGKTTQCDLHLENGSGAVMRLLGVWNDGDTEAELSASTVESLAIQIDEETRTPTAEFVLPGGITPRSTAADVISVYGNPYSTDQFVGGDHIDDFFSYHNQNESGLSYYFSFYPDGGLEQVQISISKPML